VVVCWGEVGDGVEEFLLAGGEADGAWDEVVYAVGAVVAA
jgi:hypothetical protein